MLKGPETQAPSLMWKVAQWGRPMAPWVAGGDRLWALQAPWRCHSGVLVGSHEFGHQPNALRGEASLVSTERVEIGMLKLRVVP